ncbi:MAG: HTH-type transcriptional activator RhaS [Fimbriimonadaceae bacterium]|nr:HTH-type transcriptional activator RhaS [Fimbriimonadaceae bacterium]
MNRYHRCSLSPGIEFRTSGAFAHEHHHLEWVQPSDLWQALLYRYHGQFTLNGFGFPFVPFDLIIVPPGSRCVVDCGGLDVYVYDYFTFCPVQSDRDVVSLPVRSSLGDEGYFWDMNFRKGLNQLQLTRTFVHAVVYALLWSVAEPSHHAARNVFVEEAEKIIEGRLADDLKVADLARQVHLSSSQLNRLFLSEHGMTPMQYVRGRRVQLAHRLLTESTMPIKQIAAQCGLSDVHAFNRFVRDRLGASPRDIRRLRPQVDVFRAGEFKRFVPGQDPQP